MDKNNIDYLNDLLANIVRYQEKQSEKLEEYKQKAAKELEEYKQKAAKELEEYKQKAANEFEEARKRADKEREKADKKYDKEREKAAQELKEMRKIQEENMKGIKELRKEHKEARQETKNIKESFKISKKERDEAHKKAMKEMEEIREAQKKGDIQLKETKKAIKELSQQVDRVCKQLGDMGFVQGEVAEDSIYRNISYAFNKIDKNFIDIQRNIEKNNHEFDIVAVNGNEVLLVEVKNKLSYRAIDSFLNKQIPKFRQLFPEYEKYKLLGAVGSLVVKNEIGKYAEKLGLYVITQGSEGLAEIANSRNFKERIF